MREILSRGKQNEGKWVEGVYFKHDTVKVCFSSDDPKPRHLIIQDGFCDWGFEPPIHCVDVDPETVGQFIGLTDKNGKRIFEGDIVRHNERLYTVAYVTKYARFAGTAPGCVMVIFPFGKCEIIGNIHDNPELIKEDS